MKKYKNKYRTTSTRLPNWNYGWPGAYFITICTQNRVHYFGGVKNQAVELSPVGAIANVLWYEIKHHAKNVTLGEFIVMPNHVHGILILDRDNDYPDHPKDKTIGEDRFQNQGKNTISAIVGGYKGAVTKHANRLGLAFDWQDSFWDHVVRDEDAFHRISQYIINNPKKWKNDKLNGGKGNVVLEPQAEYGIGLDGLDWSGGALDGWS